MVFNRRRTIFELPHRQFVCNCFEHILNFNLDCQRSLTEGNWGLMGRKYCSCSEIFRCVVPLNMYLRNYYCSRFTSPKY